MNYNYIMSNLNITFIFLLNYNLFTDSNGKVKLEKSRLLELEIIGERLVIEADGGWGNTIQGWFSSIFLKDFPDLSTF